MSSVKYLLEHGARITERDNVGMTALLFAARSGDLEVVQYLHSFEGGASITDTDNDGNSVWSGIYGVCHHHAYLLCSKCIHEE
jgi:ankyrin repeat protein